MKTFNLTEDQIKQIFEKWCEDYQSNPDNYELTIAEEDPKIYSESASEAFITIAENLFSN
jgi:uncharacterized protein YjaZ